MLQFILKPAAAKTFKDLTAFRTLFSPLGCLYVAYIAVTSIIYSWFGLTTWACLFYLTVIFGYLVTMNKLLNVDLRVAIQSFCYELVTNPSLAFFRYCSLGVFGGLAFVYVVTPEPDVAAASGDAAVSSVAVSSSYLLSIFVVFLVFVLVFCLNIMFSTKAKVVLASSLNQVDSESEKKYDSEYLRKNAYELNIEKSGLYVLMTLAATLQFIYGYVLLFALMHCVVSLIVTAAVLTYLGHQVQKEEEGASDGIAEAARES
ncbi:hypothetical protein AB4254_08035 [Vibrio breoganii]